MQAIVTQARPVMSHSLSSTTAGIQSDVQNLIRDMEQSINEANAFVDHLKTKT